MDIREKLVELFYDNNVICDQKIEGLADDVMDIIVPVRHGRWIHERTKGGFHIWRCDQCGRGMNDNPEGTDLYCYHCGARMDGVENIFREAY